MRALRPPIVADEELRHARYPIRIPTPAGEARFWRSRYSHENDYGDDRPKVKHREASGWLYREGERAALLKIEEYDLEPGVYWQEFWVCADGHSAQNGEAVEAMREYWGGSFVAPSDYGNIALCTGAWIDARFRSTLPYRAILDAVLPVIAPKHEAVFLMAQPSEDDDRSSNVTDLGRFEWRQRALMRFYERELGFQPLGLNARDHWWMWRTRRPEVTGYLREMREPPT